MLKFHDKLYVGVKDNKPFSTKTYPLAFATPHGTDAAFEKRKDTVDTWARGYNWQKPKLEGTVIDNVPIEGFEITRVAYRYSTDNKLFGLQDPRGFSLEISAENLCDILLNGTIQEGKIVGKYVWARNKQANFLISIDSEEYQEHLKPKIDRPLEVGDITCLPQTDVEYVYLGKFYVASAVCEPFYYDIHRQQVLTHYPPGFYGRKPIQRTYVWWEQDAKPMHLFKSVTGNDYQFRREIKKLLPKRVSESFSVPETGVVKAFTDHESLNKYYTKVIFNTKDEMSKFKYPDIVDIFVNFYGPGYTRDYFWSVGKRPETV